MFDIIYLCKTVDGKTFSFISKAILDIGMEVFNEANEIGVIEDMVMDTPVSTSEIHINYELMRTLSM